MPDYGRTDGGTRDPKDKPQPKKLRNSRRFWPTRTVGIAVLCALAGVCELIGPALLNSRRQPILTAWAIIFAGLCCLCIAGRLWIINHKTKHPMPGWLDSNWTCFACIFICLIVCLAAAGWEEKGAIITEWQPPELPEGCKVAYLCFGDKTFKIKLDDLGGGKPYVPNLGIPDDERGRALTRDFPTVILKNNRLYVHYYGLAAGETVLNSPSGLDDKLDARFDRNWNSNAVEVVNDIGCPVFQAIYEWPNKVRVNGVFIPTRKGEWAGFVWVVFGEIHKIYRLENPAAENVILETCKTNALFMYPSWKYRGVLAH